VVATGLLLMAAGLVVSGETSTPHAAFFGPVITAMVLLACGLSFITAPATEAVMGSLRADQVGAGAAVNNTTRELGGTLGVAVFGSVFNSAYGPKILRALAPYPVPSWARSAASRSVGAAVAVANHAPAAAAPTIRAAVYAGFGSGLLAACWVGAGVAVVGAVVAYRFLPGRSADPARES
jgi:hypothetical protein